jgi:kynurenine formamidase
MAETDTLVYETLYEEDGVKVSKSPWGPDDEIGRLNWLSSSSIAAVLGTLDGGRIFDLAVDYFIGMPAFTKAGDPKFEFWMTHTPQGTVNDGLNGMSREVHEKYSLCADSFLMNTHTGTHIDTLNHLGYCGRFWNGWTAEEHLGGRYWMKGGSDKFPPIVARGVLIDIAGLHGVDVLPDSYVITPEDIQHAIARSGVRLNRGDIAMIRTGDTSNWPDPDCMVNPSGIGLAAARYLCEECGAMSIACDNVSLEVMPPEDPEAYLPVHSYLFATAGTTIIELVRMDEIAGEGLVECAFIATPLKLRGSTGAPVRPIAIPLRS